MNIYITFLASIKLISAITIRSSNRVGGCHLDSTFSSSISSIFNQNISFHTPFLPPRIFDFVIFFTFLSSVSNSQNTMIKFFSTVSRINSRFVKLEGGVIGFNSNRDWSEGNCSFESLLWVNCNLWAITNGPGFISFSIIMAFNAKNAFIRIFSLCRNSMISNIKKWLIHQATQASIILVAMRTINKLLLREWDEFSIL